MQIKIVTFICLYKGGCPIKMDCPTFHLYIKPSAMFVGQG